MSPSASAELMTHAAAAAAAAAATSLSSAVNPLVVHCSRMSQINWPRYRLSGVSCGQIAIVMCLLI